MIMGQEGLLPQPFSYFSRQISQLLRFDIITNTHTHIYIHTNTHTHTHIRTHTFTNTHTQMHTYTHTKLHQSNIWLGWEGKKGLVFKPRNKRIIN